MSAFANRKPTLIDTSRLVKWLGLAAGLVVLAYVFSRLLAPGYDLYGLFYPAIRDVWQGQFTYARWPLFTNPPWVLLMLLPLGLFSVEMAHGLLVVSVLLALVWVMRDYRRFPGSYVLVVLSAPMFALVWLGQLEALSLLGAMLGYRAVTRRKAWQFALALLMLLAKPQETWVIILYLLIGSARRWSWRAWLQIMGTVAVIAVVSSIGLGFGWIPRIFNGPSYASGWQNFSLWQWGQFIPVPIVIGIWIIIAGVAAYALLRAGISRSGLGLAAVASNLLSPYLTAPHLLMTLSFGWGNLVDRSWRDGLIIYFTSLTPLLRVINADQALNRLDIVFLLLVLMNLIAGVIRRHA